ncbi:MAG: SNF2-related protein [Bacteriovorax sp.]|nr:SNF2-related protein [Bacteriovorax sp.]
MNDIGRNSPCICGSGKKYKKCCLENADISKLKSTNSHPPSNPLILNYKIQIGHPSMPKVYSGTEGSLAYLLSSLSMKEFLIYIAKGKSQKELDDSLIRLNRKSLLDCFFSRCGDDVYFNLSNETLDAQLHINAAGAIYYGSDSDEMPVAHAIYLFYRLITDNTCPWNFESMQRDWTKNSIIAKSLFDFKNQLKPITLDGIIWKSNQHDEDQIIELGKSINNLNYFQELLTLELTANMSSEKLTQDKRKILLADSEDQENLFHYLQYGTTRKNFWWDRNHDYRNLPAWDYIQFIFSDNIIFSIKDLLHHPYAVFLPQNFIPKFSSSKNMLRNYSIWNENNTEKTEQTSRIENIQKTILHDFINSKDYQSAKLKLYVSSFAPASLPYIKIDKVDFLLEENYHWEIAASKLTGKLASSLSFSKDGKTLTLNSFSEQKEIFKRLASRFQLSGISESPNEISAMIESSVDVYQLTTQFAQNISKQFGVRLNIASIAKIPDENVVVNIFLSPNGLGQYQTAFNIEVKLPDDSSVYNLSSIPQLLYRCLNGMNDGLGQFFFEYDNKNLAVQKQGDKRKNDLKLLRHSGIFKLLLAEIIRYLNTPTGQQEKIKDFEKKLVQKTLMALLGPPAENLIKQNEDQLSSRVKGLIKEFCQAIYMENNLENYLFSDGTQIHQVNLKKPILRHLESVLEWIIYSYGESSLAKIQIKELVYCNKYFPADGSFLSKKNDDPHMLSLYESGELSKGILALMGSNLYDVYISGKKIEPLSENYFSTSISLSENQGKINWFELHPQVFFNGKEISYELLQEMKEKDIVFFEGTPYHVNFNKMPKLKFLDRFWAKLKNTKNIKKTNQTNEAAIFRQEKSLLLEVLSMRNAGIEINTCTEWTKICNDFDSLMENNTDDLGRSDFKVPLKDYQKIGTQWLLNLYKIGLGGVLADDMGLGKTIQAIGFLDILRLQGNDQFHMITVPTSLIYNWTSEIKRFAPLLEVEIFESKLKNEYDNRWRKSPPKIVIITYGLLFENVDFLNQFNWNSAIFDEAQNLKNISSQRSTAARSLHSKTTICITGTPMENHYGEFYSLIDLCVPGALGDYKDFMRTFSIEGFSTATTSSKQQQSLNDEVKFLRTKTSPLVLRRMKSDLLEQLPEKSESTILIPFEKQQKEIYRNVAISWNDKIKSVIDEDSKSNTQLQMLTALLRLRQICSFPAMVEKIKYNKIPPKFQLLFESISEIYEKGESVLIFTNFLTTLEEIEKYFRETGYKTHSIHGSMSAKKRQSELQGFQENNEASILIMTLKTGGVGLNLTKASYVFHVEPWWNPASENQATDRAHRMGQTKSVQVYRYLMKDSVEEKIQELKSIKGQAFDALFKEESEAELAGSKVFAGQLSYKDFQYLLE